MATLPEFSENELIDGLLRRDANAFRVAVAQFGGPMLAAARAVGRPEYAEDIVQDAWLAALEALPSFERRSSLKTWLLRITANKAISRGRQQREFAAGAMAMENEDGVQGWFNTRGHWHASLPPHWHDNTPEALLNTLALQKCLDTHLAGMPEQQRCALALRDMQGMTMEEVCQVLEVSAANVRVLLHRARLKLVQMVNRFEETGEC